MIFKCKMCGGDIQAIEGATHGSCDSCGTTSTLPRANEERIVNLFNRANHFRRQNEFDKALATYDNILEEDPKNAEAHWGVVISRYGIEYVQDPKTGKRLPTCHRVQPTSILSDIDYLAAIENTTEAYTKNLYEEEANAVAEIQKGILAVAAGEDPYDVFICYKETAEGGGRTIDSTLAQDLHFSLEKEGLKVFFARITLENKLGRDYEPYIFNALNTAKIMLAVGTKKEYFESTWVKNEWSRFLSLMKDDRSRLLIPCYRDMDGYDIPDELSNLQAQDMGKIGFVQDLLRGIKKVLQKDEPKGTVHVAPVTGAVASMDSLLKRAFLSLEDGDFPKAGNLVEQVMNIDPENARAYICQLLVSLGLKKEELLADQTDNWHENNLFARAHHFADTAYKQTLSGYIVDAQKTRELEHAIALGKTMHGLAKAVEILEGLGEFKNSGEYLAHYKNQQEVGYNKATSLLNKKNYSEAVSLFAQLHHFKDSPAKLAQAHALDKLKKRKRIKQIAIAAVFIIIAIAGVRFYQTPNMQLRIQYQQARRMLRRGDYDNARRAFVNLWDFRDSREMVTYTDLRRDYARAMVNFERSNYHQAYEQFRELGDFQNSRKMAIQASERADEAQAERLQLAAEAERLRNEMQLKRVDFLNDALDIVHMSSSSIIGLMPNERVMRFDASEMGTSTYLEGVYGATAVSRIGGAAEVIIRKNDGSLQIINVHRMEDVTERWRERIARVENGVYQLEDFSYLMHSGSHIPSIGIVAGRVVTLTESGDNALTIRWVSDRGREDLRVHLGMQPRNRNGIDISLDMSDWEDITQVSAGNQHIVGLRTDGTVVFTGVNFFGQGNVSEWTDIIQIHAQQYATVGLRSDGTVVRVGIDYYSTTSLMANGFREWAGESELRGISQILGINHFLDEQGNTHHTPPGEEIDHEIFRNRL